MTAPLFSSWVCDYCRKPEGECVAAQSGLSITLVDIYASPSDEE